jgi:hypothetical protein
MISLTTGLCAIGIAEQVHHWNLIGDADGNRE